MLPLQLAATESYDEVNNEFIYTNPISVRLEHSLVALSKWESHFHKPFLTKEEKSPEETIYYIKCMCLDEIDDDDLENIYKNRAAMNLIFEYMNDPMTATTIKDDPNQKKSKEQVTAELIYYDMIMLQIPTHFENWHLNRLLTLIRVCSIKNAPPKKMSRNEIYARNNALNAKRQADAQARAKMKG